MFEVIAYELQNGFLKTSAILSSALHGEESIETFLSKKWICFFVFDDMLHFGLSKCKHSVQHYKL